MSLTVNNVLAFNNYYSTTIMGVDLTKESADLPRRKNCLNIINPITCKHH